MTKVTKMLTHTAVPLISGVLLAAIFLGGFPGVASTHHDVNRLPQRVPTDVPVARRSRPSSAGTRGWPLGSSAPVEAVRRSSWMPGFVMRRPAARTLSR